MSNNQKKYLTIAIVTLVVIVADKMFGLSNKAVSKFGEPYKSGVTTIRAVG